MDSLIRTDVYQDGGALLLLFSSGRTSCLKEMILPTSFHTPQSYPIAATFCVLIISYKVYTWLYPDPIMKLPVAPGGNLFGGHIHLVTEWVAQLLQMTYCLA